MITQYFIFYSRHRKKRSSKEDHMTINHRNPDYFIDHKMSIFHVKEEVINEDNENEFAMEDIMAHIKDPFNKDHIEEDSIEDHSQDPSNKDHIEEDCIEDHSQDPSNKDHIEEDNIIRDDDTQDPSNKDNIEEDNIISEDDTQDPSNKDHIEEDNVMKDNDTQDTSNKDCNEQGQFYEDFAMMAISTTESELFELLKSCEESCCIQSTRKRYHCPLCPINEFKPNIRRSAVIKHLKIHWKKRITVEGEFDFESYIQNSTS
ncbi:unnamed protein product [Owenia fusiformis]|uniref:Uncharacterized protein n=1 Tax=Owenia fusiformis TaxID=6347 RepID=A0A8S4NR44_OWEFU|nr:unnamed protein product [Owenia fusiformis]